MGLLSSAVEYLRWAFTPPALETRDWLTDDDWMWDGQMTSSGVRVTRANAVQLSAVWACVRLLANTIATLPTDIIVSVGPNRFPEFQKPLWLTSPDPADPSVSSTEHFAQVATSLLLDGNFFTYLPGSIYSPTPMHVLDPARVVVRTNARMEPVYDLLDDAGKVRLTVDKLHMLHGVWLRMPGALRGINPIDAARQTIGLGLTTNDFASRFFGQGATIPFGVEVPGTLTSEQKEGLRESLRQAHAGTAKSHNIGVLTGGATFKTGLAISNDQAQFLESRKFNVEEIARIFGIPPHMLGSQEPGASSYNSVEIRGQEFKQYAVLPLARRIEDPYQRLVEVPDRMRNASATATFRFNLDAVARADSQARAETYKSLVTSGILTPDEARALEDLPPIEGGDKAYMQQQMVPLGTTPTPPAPPPAADEPDEDDRGGVTFNLNADQVRMDPPTMPDIPAPVVNYTPPPVNVTVPETVVNVSPPEVRVPPQEPPVIDMTPVAEAIDRLSYVMRPRKRQVVRDRNGRITGITEE
jgi:HK97 family phage portal protein